MQNYIYNEITVVVSSMTRLTAQEGTLPAHLSRVQKMFLKYMEKNELKEPSECTCKTPTLLNVFFLFYQDGGVAKGILRKFQFL